MVDPNSRFREGKGLGDYYKPTVAVVLLPNGEEAAGLIDSLRALAELKFFSTQILALFAEHPDLAQDLNAAMESGDKEKIAGLIEEATPILEFIKVLSQLSPEIGAVIARMSEVYVVYSMVAEYKSQNLAQSSTESDFHATELSPEDLVDTIQAIWDKQQSLGLTADKAIQRISNVLTDANIEFSYFFIQSVDELDLLDAQMKRLNNIFANLISSNPETADKLTLITETLAGKIQDGRQTLLQSLVLHVYEDSMDPEGESVSTPAELADLITGLFLKLKLITALAEDSVQNLSGLYIRFLDRLAAVDPQIWQEFLKLDDAPKLLTQLYLCCKAVGAQAGLLAILNQGDPILLMVLNDRLDDLTIDDNLKNDLQKVITQMIREAKENPVKNIKYIVG